MALTVIKPSGIDTSGNYTVNGMNVSANLSAANLSATTSANLGAVGNITITGGSGNDVISGSTAADSITGGNGTDTITSGTGSDSVVLTETIAATDTVVTTIGAAYTTAAADVVTGFTSGATGDILQIDISDSTAIADLGVVAAGNGATAIAGNLVIQTMTAGSGITLAAATEIVVISGTLATAAALATSIGTGAGIITKSTINTATNGLLVVWYDGANTHVSTVADAGNDAAMTTADLSVVDIVVLAGQITDFNTANFVAVA